MACTALALGQHFVNAGQQAHGLLSTAATLLTTRYTSVRTFEFVPQPLTELGIGLRTTVAQGNQRRHPRSMPTTLPVSGNEATLNLSTRLPIAASVGRVEYHSRRCQGPLARPCGAALDTARLGRTRATDGDELIPGSF